MGVKEANEMPLAHGNSSRPAWVHACASANCARRGSSNPSADVLGSFSCASAFLCHGNGRRD